MSLRVIYRQEQKAIYGGNDYGVVILENTPQVRTILDGIDLPHRLPFPYLIFTIRYEKQPDGRYIYRGQPKRAFHIQCRTSPLRSPHDLVYYLPTDYTNSGLVCTNHYFDGSVYPSLEDLVKKVVSLWWGAAQQFTYWLDGSTYEEGKLWHELINDCSVWEKMSLAEAKKASWKIIGPYNQTACWTVFPEIFEGATFLKRPRPLSSLRK